jgi:Ca2+-binding RTX toxin-like protein
MANYTGGSSNDSYPGTESSDFIRGMGGDDTLNGAGGDDYIVGGEGSDTINGGLGQDRAGYYHTNSSLGGATVSLLLQGQAQYTGAFNGTDVLTGIEHLSGTPFSDSLTGDAGDNWLWGHPRRRPWQRCVHR